MRLLRNQNIISQMLEFKEIDLIDELIDSPNMSEAKEGVLT